MDYDELKIKMNYDLSQINYIMKNMENGRIYDLTRTPGEGYLATYVSKLREYLNDLSDIVQISKLGIEEPKKLFRSYDETEK